MDYAQYGDSIEADWENPYKPFAHRRDWEFAKWAKLHGPGANSLDRLLNIDEVSLELDVYQYTLTYYRLYQVSICHLRKSQI